MRGTSWYIVRDHPISRHSSLHVFLSVPVGIDLPNAKVQGVFRLVLGLMVGVWVRVRISMHLELGLVSAYDYNTGHSRLYTDSLVVPKQSL